VSRDFHVGSYDLPLVRKNCDQNFFQWTRFLSSGTLHLGIPAIAIFGAGSRRKTALSTFALPTEVYKGSVGNTTERRHKNCTRGRPREGIKSGVTLNEYSFQPLQEVPMLSASLVLGLSVRDWGTTSESVVGVKPFQEGLCLALHLLAFASSQFSQEDSYQGVNEGVKGEKTLLNRLEDLTSVKPLKA